MTKPLSPICTIIREINAPKEIVYKAWTEKDMLSKWWGPEGFTLKVKEMDPKPGGIFHYCIVGKDGSEMWGKFTFRMFEAPDKIVFINAFSDEKGNVTHAPFSETWPSEMVNKISLEEHDLKTTLTLTIEPHHGTEKENQTFSEGAELMRAGFSGTFDKLASYVEAIT